MRQREKERIKGKWDKDRKRGIKGNNVKTTLLAMSVGLIGQFVGQLFNQSVSLSIGQSVI